MTTPDSTFPPSQLLELLAFLFLENNRPDKAAILFEAMDALGQAEPRHLAGLALARLRAGDPAAALKLLDRMARQGSVDTAFHLIRAQALLALDRHEEAAVAMRAHIAGAHSNPEPELQENIAP